LGELRFSRIGTYTEADGMVRTKATWSPILALLAVVPGVGCSGGSDGAEMDQSAAGQPVTSGADESSPVTARRLITSAELMDRLESPTAPVVLDVRSPEEYAEGHIPGAINIPYDQIGAQIGSLEDYRERGLVVYCRTGRRAGVAEDVLSEAGFEQLWDLEGHMVGWQEAELPVAVPADCC